MQAIKSAADNDNECRQGTPPLPPVIKLHTHSLGVDRRRLPDCRHMVRGVCLRLLVPRRQAHHGHVPGGSAHHTPHTTPPIADNNNNWRRLLFTVVLQEGFAVLKLRRHRQMSPIVVVAVAMAVVVVGAAARFGHDRNGENETTTTTTTMAMLLFRIRYVSHTERGRIVAGHTQNTKEGWQHQGGGACPSSTFAFTFRRFVCCGFRCIVCDFYFVLLSFVSFICKLISACCCCDYCCISR